MCYKLKYLNRRKLETFSSPTMLVLSEKLKDLGVIIKMSCKTEFGRGIDKPTTTL